MQVVNSPCVNRALSRVSLKKAKKTDGSKTGRLTHKPPGFEDAHKAGTRESSKCTFIITEGDSAKACALEMIKNIPNAAAYYGVMPLRGKIMNVNKATAEKVHANKEISNIKAVLGLKAGEDHENGKGLRYGKVLVLTDADNDGDHIFALFFNVIFRTWTKLAVSRFVEKLVTPLIVASKGANLQFFSDTASFEEWKTTSSANGYTVRYVKGLGGWSAPEARRVFKDSPRLECVCDSDTMEYVKRAFDGDRANDRKKWINEAIKNPEVMKYGRKELNVSEWFSKQFIRFSIADVERSIPSMTDGLKPSQRKIVYVCFKKKLLRPVSSPGDPLRVAQLAPKVAELGYHHGEASLQDAIIKMAQTYVGSNNIPLLWGRGMFGTRLKGGKDAAQPRYIHAFMPSYMASFFCNEDAPMLPPQEDDGHLIEPYWLALTLPLVLINGVAGIGTGWSSDVLPHRLQDVAAAVKTLLDGGEPATLVPHWRGFTGTVKRVEGDTSKWIVTGTWERVCEAPKKSDKGQATEEEQQTKAKPSKIRITEIPPTTWVEPYMEMLEKLPVVKGVTRDYGRDVDITVELEREVGDEEVVKLFKLSETYSEGNMHLRDPDGAVQKYVTTNALLNVWYEWRLPLYTKRKEHMLKALHEKFEPLEARMKFITLRVEGHPQEGRINFDGIKVADFEALCKRLGLPALSGGYDYALNVKQRNLTVEEIERLKREIEETRVSIEELARTDPRDMWRTDIDKLLSAIGEVSELSDKKG